MAKAYAERLFHLQDHKEKSGQIAPAAFLTSGDNNCLGSNRRLRLAATGEESRRGCTKQQYNRWGWNIRTTGRTAGAAAR